MNLYTLFIVILFAGCSLYSMEAPQQATASKFQQLLSLSRKQLDQEIKKNRNILKEKDNENKTLIIHAIEQRKYQHVKALLVPKPTNPTKEEEQYAYSEELKILRALGKTRDLELARIILKKKGLDNRFYGLYDSSEKPIEDSFSFFAYHYNRSDDPLFNALMLADYKALDEIFSKDPTKKSRIIPTKHAAHSTPIAWAKSLKDQKLIEYLEQKGVKNEYNPHQTLASDDARNGSKFMVSIWFKNGAAVNTADRDGFTPLHWACIRGNAEMIAYLIQEGADVDMVDRDKGRTGLRWTLRMHENSVDKGGQQMITSKLLPCFFLLTSAGAESDIKDIHGQSMYQWVSRQGFSRSAENIVRDMIYRWYKYRSPAYNGPKLDINSEKEKTTNRDLLGRIVSFQINELKSKYNCDKLEELLELDSVFVGQYKEGEILSKEFFSPYLPTKIKP